MDNKYLAFITAFVNFYDDVGINDKFNKVKNKMEPSEGIQELVKMARGLVPPKLKGKEAAEQMKALDEGARAEAIESSENVINARAEFSRRVSKNQGAHGLLRRFASAISMGDQTEADEVLALILQLNAADSGEEKFNA